MAGTASMRIDEDVASAAKAAGELLGRSATQQVNHWARIGRELEASGHVSPRDIAQVLRGRASYDARNVREQAMVRAEWSERTTGLRDSLDLAGEFSAAGEGWVAEPEWDHRQIGCAHRPLCGSSSGSRSG